jgi:4-oxalocrotonate tautomerase
MPVVTIKTVEGISQEEKSLVIARITDVMREVMGKNPETTHVIIEEVPAENWGLRGKTVANIRAGK